MQAGQLTVPSCSQHSALLWKFNVLSLKLSPVLLSSIARIVTRLQRKHSKGRLFQQSLASLSLGGLRPLPELCLCNTTCFRACKNPTKPTKHGGPVVNLTTTCVLQPTNLQISFLEKHWLSSSLPQHGKLLHPRGTKKNRHKEKEHKGHTQISEEFEELGFTVR